MPRAVFAIDPGRTQGFLQVNEQTVALTQAYAHLHDNAEKVLDFPRELRLLLVDREVPQEALAGIALQTLEQMARQGTVRGLLLQLDPQNPRRLVVTLLYPPVLPGQPLITQTYRTSSSKPSIELKMNRQRVGGSIEHHDEGQGEARKMPNLAYSLRFSAPLFHEVPCTAVLVGQAAQTSPQMQVLREEARAVETRDLETLQKLSSQPANNRRKWAFLTQGGPEAESLAKQAAAKLRELNQRLKRVVVRGDRAVAVFAGKQWRSFRQEEGQWKYDR